MTGNYINTFLQYSFANEINLPTYILPSNGSAISSIDNVWHNLNIPRCSYVVSSIISDQYTVCVVFKGKNDISPNTNSFRDFNNVNTERFAENINADFLLCSLLVSNPNENAEYKVNFMKNLMNKYFSIRLKTIT